MELQNLMAQLKAYAENYLIFHDMESISEMHRITGEILSLADVLDGD